MVKRRNRLVEQKNNDIDDMSFLNDLDPELINYIKDSRLVKLKKSKKKKKANFNIGDSVEIKDNYGTIIYGPYESENGKDNYEIECENGEIITAEDNGVSIKRYIPPIEEEDDDDGLL